MIIVTGGAGFIGSAIVAQLNRRGIDDIIIVDELEYDDKWKNLRKLRFSDYVEKDVFIDMIVDEEIDEEVDAIFHMGACSSTTETDASYLIENNYKYSQALAQWAVSRGTRFIYASSAATYGDGSAGFGDDENELRKLSPLNMYGYSKHLFDLWAKDVGLLDKIVGLKYFNVFGSNEYHKGDMRSFVLKAFEQISDCGKVKLFKSGDPQYGDGEYVRDFIYVKDAVEQTLFFMDNPEIGGIFNVGTGKARNWNDMAKAVFNAMEQKCKIDYVDMPEYLQSKYQYYTQAEMGKLKKAGYDKEATSLEDAARDYVQNYLMKNEYLGS